MAFAAKIRLFPTFCVACRRKSRIFVPCNFEVFAMIDSSTIDRIMAAADIVDVVGEFVTLRRSGANFKGLCPFHDERTPSFMVSQAKQICKCFSCGEGGNVVQFVMKHEQMTYPEALKWLGRKYGIEVKERELSEEEKTAATTREAMFVVNEWARDYFVDTLHNSVDGMAIGLSYFRRRGLRDDIIRKFQLGYSLEARDALAQTARGKGYEEKFLESTGLCYRTDDGRLLDRYHGRVIFPVHSVSGRVVAFGGRILNTENKKVGKYVNSPESEIYSKKRELYGLYQAKQAIVKQDRCFLVEGYLDVISMHQNGVENVVASSGTSLTAEQVRLIHRFTNNVTVLYDGDAAGIHASLRGIDMLLSEGLNIKVLLLPAGEDPDSFAQKHSAADFQQYIEKEQQDFIRFKTELLMGSAKGDPMKRAEVIRDIVRSIAVIPSDIVRQVYVHELSSLLGLEENVIVSEVAQELRRIQSERRAPRVHQAADSSTHAAGLPNPTTEQSTTDTTAISVEKGHTTPSTFTQSEIAALSSVSPALRRLEACERQLMEWVVRYGHCPLIAPIEVVEPKVGKTPQPDSESVIPDSPPLAVYVQTELHQDEIVLKAPLHQRILEECAEHASEENFNARDYFMRHSDPTISNLASALGNDQYQLSTLQQRQYLPDEKRLSEIIPRLINDYKHAILGVHKEEILFELRQPATHADEERTMELMRQLVEINQLEMIFAKILGDRVLNR